MNKEELELYVKKSCENVFKKLAESEECKQELLKYYKKKKLYMKNGVFSLEGDKKTYEDMIFELQDENQTLKDNWDKLKEYIRKTKLNEFEKSYGKRYGKTFTQAEVIVCNIIINHMQKLEEGEN